MSTAHTPRPWEVNAKDFCVYTTDDTLIATARTLPDMHLIGAAPEMLAVLRRLEWSGRQLEAGVSRCPVCGQTERNPHTPACVLGDAIAKATGARS